MKETDLRYLCLDWWRVKSHVGFPGGANGKNPSANAGDARDMGSIPGLERSPGVRNGNPLQYSCLENSMGRGAKSWTWPSNWTHSHVAVWSAPECEVSGVNWGNWASPVCWVLLGLLLSWGCVFPVGTRRTPLTGGFYDLLKGRRARSGGRIRALLFSTVFSNSFGIKH